MLIMILFCVEIFLNKIYVSKSSSDSGKKIIIVNS